MKLSEAGKKVLLALANGWTLKSHRYLDGRKLVQLHPLDGRSPQTVAPATIEALREGKLIESNKKFPAATYLLTEKGRETATALGQAEIRPLGPRDYFSE